MKRSILAIFAIVALAARAGAAYAQETPASVPFPSDTITVVGTGTAYGEPDVGYIELGVEMSDANLGAAFEGTANTMNAIIGTLTELGIDRTDIQTTGVNVYPQDRYDPQTGAQLPDRTYMVRNTVRVTVRDISQIETIITAAVDAGANTIYNLSFGIDDTSELANEARVLAVEDARTRANQLASALGVTLGSPVVVSEVIQGQFPDSVWRRGSAALMDSATQPVSAGQLSVSVQVQITFRFGE